MNRPQDPHADLLNDWIDARHNGTQPPIAPPTDPDLADLFATADQLDHLARLGDEHALLNRPPRTSWEHVMHAAPARFETPSSFAPVDQQPAPAPRSDRRPKPRPLYTLVAAALVMALLAGVWNANGRPGWPGGDSGPPTMLEYGSFAVQGEDERFEIAPLPEASECTVTPLTVDEVMDGLIGYPYPDTSAASPTPPASPPADQPLGQPELETVDQATIAAIEPVFRQWVACHRAGNLFAAWALESPFVVPHDIMGLYGPLVSLESIRADLEARADDANASTPLDALELADDTLIPMLVTTGWDATAPYGSDVSVRRIPIYWTSLDGSIAGVPGYLTQEQYNDPAYEVLTGRFLPNAVEFSTHPVTGEWMITDFNVFNAG